MKKNVGGAYLNLFYALFYNLIIKYSLFFIFFAHAFTTRNLFKYIFYYYLGISEYRKRVKNILLMNESKLVLWLAGCARPIQVAIIIKSKYPPLVVHTRIFYESVCVCVW